MNDALRGRKVNLFCLGAQKSGTTTLYTVLGQHPEITFAKIKEVQYFATDPFDNDPRRYHAFFRGRVLHRWIADFTPRYLAHPRAAERIAAYNPQAHLIILLRNPVDRAISHYQMKIRNGNERRPFAEVIESDMATLRDGLDVISGQSVVGRGLYMAQLARYDALFPANQIHLLRFEALVNDQEAIVNTLLAELGCEPMRLTQPIHANPAFQPRFAGLWRAVSRIPMAYSAKLRMLLRNAWRKRNDQPMAPVDEASRRRLTAFYRDDILALQQRTGWDLSDWLMIETSDH